MTELRSMPRDITALSILALIAGGIMFILGSVLFTDTSYYSLSPIPELILLTPVFQLVGTSSFISGAVFIAIGIGLRKLKPWSWWLAVIGGFGNIGMYLYTISLDTQIGNAINNSSVTRVTLFLLAPTLAIVIDLLVRRKFFGSIWSIPRLQLVYLAAFALAPLVIANVGIAAYAPQLEEFSNAAEKIKQTSPAFLSSQEGKVFPLGSKAQPIFSCSNPPSKEQLGIRLKSCQASMDYLNTSSAGEGSYKIIAVDTPEKKFEHEVHYQILDAYKGYFVGPRDLTAVHIRKLAGRGDPMGDKLLSVLDADDDTLFSKMVWSNSGKELILLTSAPGFPTKSSIWTVNIDTGEIREVRVALTIFNLVQLRLSPDDKHLLATIRGEGGDTRLIKISTVNGTLENIADTTEFGDFMPDGSIVYVQQTGEEGSLYLVRSTDLEKASDRVKREIFYGREDELLYEGKFPSLLTNDYVSKDGSKMTFIGENYEEGKKFITTFDLNDKEFKSARLDLQELGVYPLSQDTDEVKYNSFDWSPSGSYVAATIRIDGVPWDMLVAMSSNGQGSFATADTIFESWDGKYTKIRCTSVSPDGKQIAFASTGSSENSGIYIAELSNPY